MTISYYDIGDAARVTGAFQQVDGTFVDPSTVTFTFTTPAGAATTYTYGTDAELVKDSTGHYHVDLTPTTPGLWSYKYAGTGNFPSVQTGEFLVAGGLIVEDGTGRADAQSYASVAEADAYHAASGSLSWGQIAPALKESALRKATAFLMQLYRPRWKGYRAVTTQALDWPRTGVAVDDIGYSGFPLYVAINVVPAEVKNACCELALRANAGDLAPDIDREVVRVKVGPIEKQYSESAPLYKRYRSIDLMLRPYLLTGGGELLRG